MPKEYTLIGGNGTVVSPLEVTEDGDYVAGDSRAFNPVKVRTGGSSTLSGLTDVDISNPTDGQTLVYDAASSKWVNGSGGGGVLVVNIDAEGAFDQTWQTIKDAGFCVFRRHFSDAEGEFDSFSNLASLSATEAGYYIVIMSPAENIADGYVGEVATTMNASGYPVIVPSN